MSVRKGCWLQLLLLWDREHSLGPPLVREQIRAPIFPKGGGIAMLPMKTVPGRI